MTITLKDIQIHFQNYLQDKENNLQDYIITGNTEVDVRLNVYHNAYVVRLIEMLERDFPVIQLLLGNELFNKICHQYLRKYPSKHFSIRYFGKHFPEFIAHTFMDNPEYAEMAHFEWALQDVLDNADGPVLTSEELQAVPPEKWMTLHFSLHPSLQVQFFHFNIPSTWQSLIQKNEKPILQYSEEKMPVMIWRHKLAAHFTTLNREEHWIISAIHNGKRFDEICAYLSQHVSQEEIGQLLGDKLHHWIADSAFSAITHD